MMLQDSTNFRHQNIQLVTRVSIRQFHPLQKCTSNIWSTISRCPWLVIVIARRLSPDVAQSVSARSGRAVLIKRWECFHPDDRTAADSSKARVTASLRLHELP